jgi:rubrerythrin
MSGEQQTLNYYQNIGPLFADPAARLLYAEIGHIEEQHVTQYESIIDPGETWLEKWLMHEACEVYNYYGCMEQESNPRIRAIWERFLDYELGHLNMVVELFKQHERRDPAELLPQALPDPIPFDTQREFVRQTLAQEVDLRASGTEIVPKAKESAASRRFRESLNADGSPSEIVAAGYRWSPGSELKRKAA